MLDYSQSFEEFSGSLQPIDLALYAGVGLVLWVLFKDKLSPVQSLLGTLIENTKNLFSAKPRISVPVPVPVPAATNVGVSYNNPSSIFSVTSPSIFEEEDLFFKLIVSWKETRDLAVKCGCDKAIDVIDSAFPHLSPVTCKERTDETVKT